MDAIIAWINVHGIFDIGLVFVFAAGVSTMPPLSPEAGYFQRWAYGFLHVMSANLKGGIAVLLANGKSASALKAANEMLMSEKRDK